VRIEAYLRIGGDEMTILAIHEAVNIKEARVKAYPKLGEWGWATTPIRIDFYDPDSGLKALLKTYEPIFLTIRRHRTPDTAVTLQVVTQYSPGEDPRGLHLSDETISLLCKLGGALDNDVGWILDECLPSRESGD